MALVWSLGPGTGLRFSPNLVRITSSGMPVRRAISAELIKVCGTYIPAATMPTGGVPAREPFRGDGLLRRVLRGLGRRGRGWGLIFSLQNKIADGHESRNERDGVGEIGERFAFVRLDVDHDPVPAAGGELIRPADSGWTGLRL